MTTDCVFCKILSGEFRSSMIYKDDLCAAFLDIQPVNPGHVLIVPIAHAPYVADVPDEVISRMFLVGKKISGAIRRSGLKCEGINFFLADGEAAMQEVFHSHLHVFPRFENDGFGLKHGPAYFEKPSREQLDAAAKKIRENL